MGTARPQGISSAEQYAYVLQKGCRCVEIDCWDGAPDIPDGNPGDEPIVTHGNTFCSKITFRSVIQAMRDSAFAPPANNPYPVVISIEMHCSYDFQQRMFEICMELLGDMLLILPDEADANGMSALPSPEALKHRIIIKGKRGMQKQQESDSGPEEESEDEDELFDGRSRKPKRNAPEMVVVHTNPDWAGLPYLSAVKFKGFHEPGSAHEMSSFSEHRTRKLLDSPMLRDDFIKYNRRQMSRIYPKGSRVDSSNLNPVPSWAAGAQMCALNFQTGDAAMSLNYGRFAENAQYG